MKHFLMLAAVLALATSPAMIASAASSSAPPAGPYKLDAKGKCHAANGQLVTTSLCHAPSTATSSHPPHCTTGVPCGNTCIAKGKVCHK